MTINGYPFAHTLYRTQDFYRWHINNIGLQSCMCILR